jgi:hypothetical protein
MAMTTSQDWIDLNSDHLPFVDLQFRFYGEDFDPAELTKRLGVSPTTEFRPGDPITEDGRGHHRRSGWFIAIDGREAIFIDEMLTELQERVTVSGATVKKTCSDIGVEAVIVCGVHLAGADAPAPALSFPVDFLEWSSEMGASINIDVGC